MTEEQIERRAESRVDELDRAFLKGLLTQEQYNAGIRGIDVWALRELSRHTSGA